jgi:hypothetical protein
MNCPARWRLTCRQASVRTPGGGCLREREPGLMADEEYQPVVVSRRICAPAHDIFGMLASPARHQDMDGSAMLRGAVSATMITGVGDVFVMRMHFSRLGDYEMNNHVVEYEQDRRIGWEPEAGHGHPHEGRSRGAAMELPAHSRWPGCDRRDRDLRLLTSAGRRSCRDGQREGMDREHDQDPRTA